MSSLICVSLDPGLSLQKNMSQENLSLGFPTMSDTKRAAQPQKMIRDSKILE